MIKMLSISFGLVGLTAVSGIALSMAHDLSFAGAERVAPEEVMEASFAQPAVAGTAVATDAETLEATPGDAQVLRAMVESSGPPNRLAGKSIATASENAPATTTAPPARVEQAALALTDDVQRRDDALSREPRATIGAPVFEREPSFTYVSTGPVATAPRPIESAVGSPTVEAKPSPTFLIGVFR